MAAAQAYAVLLRRRGPGVPHLLRDDFPVDQAAPMGTSPFTRPCAPGPGTLYLTQRDGAAEWEIAGRVLQVTASAAAAPMPTVSTALSWARQPGLALKVRVAQRPNGPGPNEQISPLSGWSSSSSSIGATSAEGLLFFTGGVFTSVERSASAATLSLNAYAANVMYTLTIVLRGAGFYAFVDNTLAYVSAAHSTTPVFPFAMQLSANRHTPRVSAFRVGLLGGPWQTSHGFATAYLPGARSVGDAFVHPSNRHWTECALTALPSAGSIRMAVRQQDANNRWEMEITSGGTLALVEVVGGTPTTRLTLTGCLAGDRLMLVMDGARAQLLRSRAGAGASSGVYAAAGAFASQTAGALVSLGTGGALADICTFPLQAAGLAKAWLDAL